MFKHNCVWLIACKQLDNEWIIRLKPALQPKTWMFVFWSIIVHSKYQVLVELFPISSSALATINILYKNGSEVNVRRWLIVVCVFNFLGCSTSLCYWPHETAWPNQNSVFQKCEPVVYFWLDLQRCILSSFFQLLTDSIIDWYNMHISGCWAAYTGAIVTTSECQQPGFSTVFFLWNTEFLSKATVKFSGIEPMRTYTGFRVGQQWGQIG